MTTLAAATIPARSAAPADGLALAGRVLLAAIFLLSGFAKLADPAGTAAYVASASLPAPMLAGVAAGLLEVAGALALIAGFRTRIAALALAGFSLAAALLFHAALGDQNQFIHFFKNVAIAGGLLQLAAFGPGRFALSR